jgi:hypothetical protein
MGRAYTAILAGTVMFGCTRSPNQAAYGEQELIDSAEKAIAFMDEEAAVVGLHRDSDTLSDETLIEEATSIADYASQFDCDIDGILGGVWVDEPIEVVGGTFNGGWFALEKSELAGTLEGTHQGVGPDDGGGLIDGTWVSTDERTGTQAGDYYRFEEGEGSYLGTFDEEGGDAAGVLGGLWYRFSEEGGGFFGVWANCGDKTADIEPVSY